MIKVLADRDYASNDKIFISFGLKSSAECLEDHGIVPDIDISTDASCEFTVQIDPDTDRFADDKVNILEDAGLTSKQRFDLEVDLSIDPALLSFLRLKFIEGKDAFILEACFSDVAYSTMSQPFSKANEMKVMSFLVNTCTSLLENLNSFANEDEDASFSSSSSSTSEQEMRATLMRELRMQERAALKSALSYAQDELRQLEGAGLDTREYYQERRLRELNLLRPLDESEIIMPGERAPIDYE